MRAILIREPGGEDVLRLGEAPAPPLGPADVRIRVTATAEDDGEIMAVEHREYPVTGVQFHPESAATEYGYWILDRFIRGDGARREWSAGADGTVLAPRRDEAEPFVPPSVELVR